MSEKNPQETKQDARQDKRAAALRENIKKRKGKVKQDKATSQNEKKANPSDRT